MQARLPDDVVQAIEQAKRTAGWNNRKPDVRRFELENRDLLTGQAGGHAPCVLYVVPARVWAYRSWERQAQRHGGRAA